MGFAGSAGAGGYGNPAYLNGGCFQPNTASTFGAGFNTPIAPSSCTANVEKTQELSIGFWQAIYKGDLGQVRVGAPIRVRQVGSLRRHWHAPSHKGGGRQAPAPNAGLNPYNNIVFFSLRYYPFN